MRDAIIVNPAFCDFTKPPVELALLKAACAGQDVHCVDANLRAFGELTGAERIADMVATGEARLSALVKRTTLGFWEQQELHHLAHALSDGIKARDTAGEAMEIFRDEERFFTRDGYTHAVKTAEATLALASALCFPFKLSAAGIGAPFSVYSEQAVARFRAVDPFRSVHDKLVAETQARSVVIVLSTCGQFLPACALAATLREKKPEITLVVCGPWVEQIAREDNKLLHSYFDVVVTTDAERILPSLLSDGWKTQAGVTFGDRVKTEGKAKAHAPLDVETLPLPDFSDLPLEEYPTPETVLTYRATRDRCVTRSTGNLWGLSKRARTMSAGLVAEQLRQLAEKHEARLVMLTGDAYELSWLEALAQALGSGTLKWSADAIIDRPVSDAAALKASGCVTLCFGVHENKDTLGRTAEALAHAGIAVQVTTAIGMPGETEDLAREALSVLKSHHQEIDLVNVVDHESCTRLSVDTQGTWLAGDGFCVFPEFARLSGMQRDRIAGELDRVTHGYQTKRQPFAGAVGSAHTLLGFEQFGRRVFSRADKPAQALAPRLLTDGDRIKLSESAKMLWIPYQLSVFGEILNEELELRSQDLLRRQKDVGADKVWTYSQRSDLSLRAQDRTPHVLGPGMPVTEISFGLADLLSMIVEQPMQVSQLVAKAAREQRDALRRQLQGLFGHGALVSDQQARQGQSQQQPQGQPGGQGNGKRRRRRRRGGGGPRPQQPHFD